MSAMGRRYCGGVSDVLRLIDTQLAAQFGDMAGRLDVVESPFDAALLVDDEGGPDDSGDRLPVELLLAVRAIRRQYPPVLIRHERKRQTVPLAELGELGRGVGGDPDHLVPGAAERRERVAEIARLFGAARCHGGRVR